MFSYPVLLGDIGGTNARFALAARRGGSLSATVRLKTNDFAKPADGLREAASRLGSQPMSVILCAAGPVSGRSVALTNAGWRIDGPALAEALGLEQGLLFNDFEALALALPALPAAAFRHLGGRPHPAALHAGAAMTVIGAGTGLGAAALVATGRRYLALPSEAGHASLAAEGELETEIFRLAARECGRVSAETFLSGPGLERLHRLRIKVEGVIAAGGVTASEISQIAAREPASHAARSVSLFWRLLGRFSGDIGLVHLARGGVVLSGGLIEHLAPALDEGEFLSAFRDKGPMAELATSLPVSLLVKSDPVLAGMAAMAADPAQYAIDFANRMWR